MSGATTPPTLAITATTAATGPYGKQERNAPCACGSGKKFKKCHYVSDHETWRQAEIARRAQWAREAEHEDLIRQGRGIPPRRGAAAAALLLAMAAMP